MQLIQSCGFAYLPRHLTSVAHPLLAECVQGLFPPQLVQATISLGPLASRFFSFLKLGRSGREREIEININYG